MKLLNLVVFILLLFSLQLSGQGWDTYPIKENRVIAVPGLNMRTQPNLNGAKIAFIPFGKEVKILESDQFYQDTVGEIKNFRRDVLRHRYPNPVIDGYWVKARYKGKVGYVFSAYLIDYRLQNEYARKSEEKWMNKDFVLLFEGANCMDNTYYKKDWHYYAAQAVEGGICLVPVEMSFIKSIDGYANLRTHSSAKEFSPKFIIGSRRPVSTEKIRAKVDLQFMEGDTLKIGEGIPSQLQLKPTGKRFAPDLILTKNENTQILNPFIGPEKTTKNRPGFIHFIGDLDGDKKEDYIIAYGEKFSQTVLYLSSKAGTNEIVKPVAIWYTGYCC